MERLGVQQYLSLHKNAGASGQTMAVDLVARMVQSLNVAGGDLWERFKIDEPLAFFELGTMSITIVSTHPLSLIL